MAERTESDWIALSKQAITDLLDREHAAPSVELEARISDAPWHTVGERIEPHLLHQALAALRQQGHIDTEVETPRGIHPVSVWYPIRKRRRTAIAKAAGRKRLLMSRYLGWSQGTPSRTGVVGPSGERVVHASLREAAAHGFRLVKPEGGEVREFLGYPVPVSALDNATILTLLVDGVPGASVALPIEVKNIRDWIYPSSQEPYQLLEKAALLQQKRPDVLIVPVLICRRAHITAFRMAKDLGFFIADTRRQYITGVEEEKLSEIHQELGLLDLVLQENEERQLIPDERLIRRLIRTLPNNIEERAERWGMTANDQRLCRLFTSSRNSGHRIERSRNVEVIRELVRESGLYNTKGW